jgi:hypothetical protein
MSFLVGASGIARAATCEIAEATTFQYEPASPVPRSCLCWHRHRQSGTGTFATVPWSPLLGVKQ